MSVNVKVSDMAIALFVESETDCSSIVYPQKTVDGFQTQWCFLDGPTLVVECRDRSSMLKLMEHKGWRSSLTNHKYVAFCIADRCVEWEPVRVTTQSYGGNMNALTGASTEIDIFKQLSKISLETNRDFMVVSMRSDRPLHSTSTSLCWEGLTLEEWMKNNRKGWEGKESELNRFKTSLDQSASIILPAEMLDFDRPNLDRFRYQAISLVRWGRTIEMTVNAWICKLQDGTVVRITESVRPIQFIDP